MMMSVNEITRQLDSGQVSALELVEERLSRIGDTVDAAVFITLTAEQALAEARASDRRRARQQLLGPWDGVPMVWKDLFDIEGLITTAGAQVRREASVAVEDARVVSACRQQGLISLGKTNLSEFAYSGLGLNPHFGTPVNPASGHQDRVPGGSSSGSAVAVASDLVPIAVGTDTAGSVRVPASFCGIVGYKSTQTRYPNSGVFPLSRSLDSTGLFAHDMHDILALDAIMRGKPPVAARLPSVGTLSFLIPENQVFDGIQPAVLARFEQAVHELEKQGASIQRQPLPMLDEVSELFQRHGTLTVAEAATLHQSLLASREARLMDSRVRERMGTAADFTAQDYIHLQWARQRLEARMEHDLGERLLLMPTTVITAPAIAPLEADDECFKQTNLLALRNTMPGNYLGTPGVSLPVGSDDDGLPVGMQVSAPSGQDDRVMLAAAAMQSIVSMSQA